MFTCAPWPEHQREGEDRNRARWRWISFRQTGHGWPILLKCQDASGAAVECFLADHGRIGPEAFSFSKIARQCASPRSLSS